MSEKPTSFEELLADLSRHNVEYILVGGLAVALCGFVRASLGLDILVQADQANLRRLLQRLEKFGEGHARELAPSDFPLEEGSIRIVEEFPVDVFTLMSGHRYEDLLNLTARHRIDEIEVVYLNAEGLITLKVDSLRPRDQIDVQALRDILQDKDRSSS